MATTRSCEHCGRELVRRVSPSGRIEKPSAFAARRFCNMTCAGDARADPLTPARECKECGRGIPRRYSNGKRIAGGKYARRQYCSAACRSKSQRLLPPVRYAPSAIPAVNGDWLPVALRFHPALLDAFAEVERHVNLDSWEPHQSKGRRAA